jgi:hypothetical protein
MKMTKSNDEENNLEDFEFDGMSPLEQDAANMHEIFVALVGAGFNEPQALRLVSYLVETADGSDMHIHLNNELLPDDDDED